MRPSEVRERVLQDHEGLRRDLEQLETLTRHVRREQRDGDLTKLRADAKVMLDKLQNHMEWEERYLLPALRDADAWGEERATRLIDDHAEQRRLLDFIVERLGDERRTQTLVVKDVFDLIAYLREDMHEEERELLDERVLRDDTVAIDVEAG